MFINGDGSVIDQIGVEALVTVVATLFLGLISCLWSLQTDRSPAAAINSKSGTNARCTSPDCVRCNRYSDLLAAAPQRLEEFRRSTDAETLGDLTRIEHFVLGSAGTSKIVGDHKHQDFGEAATVYGASNSSFVLFVPGVEARCWHDSTMALRNAVLSGGYCDSTTLEDLKEEFQRVWYDSTAQWQFNSTQGVEAGWQTLYLINQGQKIARHFSLCPKTAAALEKVGAALMRNCVFTNACFSVLEPGAHITPHHGPCNVRVRCHVPLYTPRQCWLRVGIERRYWSDIDGSAENGCFLFDDAFEHEVQHEGCEEDGARVIFMFDLWHPDLSDIERRAISHMFPPLENDDASSKDH